MNKEFTLTDLMTIVVVVFIIGCLFYAFAPFTKEVPVLMAWTDETCANYNFRLEGSHEGYYKNCTSYNFGFVQSNENGCAVFRTGGTQTLASSTPIPPAFTENKLNLEKDLKSCIQKYVKWCNLNPQKDFNAFDTCESYREELAN